MRNSRSRTPKFREVPWVLGCSWRKETTIMVRQCEDRPPVKTVARSLETKSCFSTSTRGRRAGNWGSRCWL